MRSVDSYRLSAGRVEEHPRARSSRVRGVHWVRSFRSSHPIVLSAASRDGDPGREGAGSGGTGTVCARSFRPRAALSCVVPRAAGAGPAAGCRPARRGVGRVYAGRYHAGRSSTRRRHEAFPTRGSRSRRFLPRHTVPSRLRSTIRGISGSYRSDRITNRFDADERGAGYAYIYTHCCAPAAV